MMFYGYHSLLTIVFLLLMDFMVANLNIKQVVCKFL